MLAPRSIKKYTHGLETPNLFYRFARGLLFAYFKIFNRLEIIGLENVPREGGVIIAPNHRSYADPPLAGLSVPRETHFMAKKELFRFGPFASVISRLNAHPLNRSAGAGAIRNAEKLLKEGRAILIFPEGKRVKEKGFGTPKPGLGLLVARSQKPVTPVLIENSDQAIFFKKIRVIIGKPLFFSADSDPRAIGQQVMVALEKLREERQRARA